LQKSGICKNIKFFYLKITNLIPVKMSAQRNLYKETKEQVDNMLKVVAENPNIEECNKTTIKNVLNWNVHNALILDNLYTALSNGEESVLCKDVVTLDKRRGEVSGKDRA